MFTTVYNYICQPLLNFIEPSISPVFKGVKMLDY